MDLISLLKKFDIYFSYVENFFPNYRAYIGSYYKYVDETKRSFRVFDNIFWDLEIENIYEAKISDVEKLINEAVTEVFRNLNIEGYEKLKEHEKLVIGRKPIFYFLTRLNPLTGSSINFFYPNLPPMEKLLDSYLIGALFPIKRVFHKHMNLGEDNPYISCYYEVFGVTLVVKMQKVF